MRYDTIPEELRKLNQWVCVSADSKVPQRALSFYPASSTNPTTWSSFEDAVLSVNVGLHDYIGFVFNDNGIVGIDIDDGYAPDGSFSDLARDILSHCWSYTERSKSGRGFHIFVQGDIPFKGKNNLAGVEVYKTSRFFIMTGDVMLERYDLRTDQSSINYIVDKYFPETRGPRKTSITPRIYSPEWDCPKGNKRVKIRPNYPVIPDGCRNICLTSLAGMMHSIGYTKGQIYRELQYANSTACKPPLLDSELKAICNSVTRYLR
jgi:hypothetical protein